MALNDFKLKKCEKAVAAFMKKRRPPAHVRKDLDLRYRIKGQSMEIFEIRPLWSNPDATIEQAVAKATFVRKTNTWKVYWQRADLKWHLYDHDPEVGSAEAFLAIVDQDEHGCFFG